MIYVPDTHALVWFLSGDSRLSAVALGALLDDTSTLAVPTIVLAEIAFLSGRNKISVSLQAVLSILRSLPNTVMIPMTAIIVERAPMILEMHDALIVASTLVYQDDIGMPAAVITRDRQILDSGLVATLW